MSDTGFVECDTCRAKSGTPLLCDACIRNRELIDGQAEQIRLLKEKAQEDRKIICPQADELRRLKRLEDAFNVFVASQATRAGGKLGE